MDFAGSSTDGVTTGKLDEVEGEEGKGTIVAATNDCDVNVGSEVRVVGGAEILGQVGGGINVEENMDGENNNVRPNDPMEADDNNDDLMKAVVDYVVETRPEVLARREGQFKHVYESREYNNYVQAVPKHARDPKDPSHPMTPNKNRQYSRRSWEALCKKWKADLRTYWSDRLPFFSSSWADDVEDYYFGEDGPGDDYEDNNLN